MTKKWPAPRLFLRRGRVWTIVYYEASGRRRQKPTPFGPTQDGLAKKALALFTQRREAAAMVAGEDDADGPLTVSRWAARWLKTREAKGISTAKDYRSKLDLHILPHIGHLLLDKVTPEHITEVMVAAGKTGLAPRSQRHIYFTTHAMFQKAIPRFIVTNPCCVDEEDLPTKKDKDPEWRPTAIFTREEAQVLITSELVPWERRILYAILFLTGCRFGEASALKVRHYLPDMEPLGQIKVARSFNTKQRVLKDTKTEKPRLVPVHPWLALLLADWLRAGWAELMGRVPGPDDILVPTRRNAHRQGATCWKQLQDDLTKLGLRPRRQHDARRTMITLCRADGARKDILRLVTHGPEGDIVDVYSEIPWATLCEELVKLEMGPPEPRPSNVLDLTRAARLSNRNLKADCCPTVATPKKASNITRFGGDPSGIRKGLHGVSQGTPGHARVGNTEDFEGPADAEAHAGQANPGPDGPLATVATIALRQAMAALERGRLDQVREILTHALDAESEEGGAARKGVP